jgi:hypothetical protein
MTIAATVSLRSSRFSVSLNPNLVAITTCPRKGARSSLATASRMTARRAISWAIVTKPTASSSGAESGASKSGKCSRRRRVPGRSRRGAVHCLGAAAHLALDKDARAADPSSAPRRAGPCRFPKSVACIIAMPPGGVVAAPRRPVFTTTIPLLCLLRLMCAMPGSSGASESGFYVAVTGTRGGQPRPEGRSCCLRSSEETARVGNFNTLRRRSLHPWSPSP